MYPNILRNTTYEAAFRHLRSCVGGVIICSNIELVNIRRGISMDIISFGGLLAVENEALFQS